MKKIAVLAVVFVVVILAGCAYRYQSRWDKPDFVMEDFRKAEREYVMYADPVSYQAGAAYADNPFKQSLIQDAWIRAFENCMISKGYTKVERTTTLQNKEYKKTINNSVQNQTDNTDTDKKLQELSELHKNGVLSEADYNKARKRLTELQKLNELRQSGILSEEEYDKAKARLKEK